jgi:hypothetical protein
MTYTEYGIEGYSPTGTRIGKMTGIRSVEFALASNRAGVLIIESTDKRFKGKDYQLEVWRSRNREPLKRVVRTRFFIRKFKTREKGGVKLYVYTAYGALSLLDRRIVGAYAGSAGAAKSTAADLMLKTYVSEAFNNNAWNGYRFNPMTVSLAASAVANVSRSFAWQRLTKVAEEIAQTLLTADGTRLYYDIEYETAGPEFKTFIGQRGTDRRKGVSPRPMVFSPEKGNLDNIEVEESWEDEASFVYVGGKGNEATRLVAGVENVTRQAETPYSSTEVFLNATNLSTTADLQNAGRAALAANRYTRRFTADIVQTTGAVVGVDWEWGDYVTAYYDGITYDARIEAVRLKWERGRETVDARLYA